MTQGLLAGKNAIVLGVANKRSIAWSITQALAGAGARLALTYQGPRFEDTVKGLAADLDDPLLLPCDVGEDGQIDECFAKVGEAFGSLHILIHSIAFARREELTGAFVDTSRDGYRLAQEISSYSLTALARGAVPYMDKEGGAILALTYLGSERVVPNYNVMGVAKAALESSIRYLASDLGPRNIRVNGISAGPIQTVSARGIAGFTGILAHIREKAPLRRNTDPAEVGDAALFLCSDMGRGVTGEILHVDSGYHIMGM